MFYTTTREHSIVHATHRCYYGSLRSYYYYYYDSCMKTLQNVSTGTSQLLRTPERDERKEKKRSEAEAESCAINTNSIIKYYLEGENHKNVQAL